MCDVPVLELWLIGNASPSICAGHSMLCPYEETSYRGESCEVGYVR
jgi:hypothetical protein